MMMKKRFEKEFVRSILGIFFVILGILSSVALPFINTNKAFAEPETSEVVEVDGGNEARNEENNSQELEETNGGDNNDNGNNVNTSTLAAATGDNCKASLGELGWWGCPVIEKIAEATDWLYDKLKGVLEINPVAVEDGTPIYEIWKYCLNVTNVVFVIFLLVVVYSQLTGVGITNYGIKKVLPKLIVAAVLVNLSFLICTLAVDLSNIIGNGLRGVFDGVEQSVMASSEIGISTTASGDLTTEAKLSYASMYGSMAAGTMLTVGGVIIAFESGVIWMLIPVILGAIVAVVSGLITVALRQAVVVLLIMVAPLAIVASMLPNTENLFKKWKQLFIKMLVFYPMFSLLFGASSLAGFAIIASAKDGFGVLLGTAVQIFPLFFSWSLMKMSGTFLGTINAKMRGFAAKPLAANRAWADSRRQLTRQKYLASSKAYTPSLKLRQFLSDRKVAREEEVADYAAIIKNRGLAYNAARKYGKNGTPNKDAEEDYEMQARNMQYTRVIERHKNNMAKGLGQLEVTKTSATAMQKARLGELDKANVKAADLLKAERARAEKIEYDNAVGFHKRMEDAINVHMDDENAAKVGSKYAKHFNNEQKAIEARDRYDSIKKVMEGDTLNTQYVAAMAAHNYDTQAKIVMTKFQKYFELTPPTRDLRYRMEEFSRMSKMAADGIDFDIKAADNIDAIVSGLRILNQRGDTDFVKDILDDILDGKYGGLRLGSHASQSLASFLMFDVKDNDPYLRRFGKYINLETARMYDKNERKKETVDYDEYIKGYHIEPDGTTMYAKKDMVKLMEGTSLDGIERTALDNYDKSLRKAYTDENGVLDLEAYEKKKAEVDKATAPQFISANLKFLSGSEQIVSAVKSKTGFAAKQDQETGEYYMMPIWDDEKEIKQLFDQSASDEDKKKAKNGLKKWYRDQTLKYLMDQTPFQLLGLRSDYHDGLREHLADAFMLEEYSDLTDEEREKRSEYEQEVSRIRAKYGDAPVGAAKRDRDKEMASAKEKIAGVEFRKLLDSKGKLEQIYRTRRSGAANNAKDWVREWLDLDNELMIRKFEKDRNEQRKKEMRLMEEARKKDEKERRPEEKRTNKQGADPEFEDISIGRIYDEADMALYQTEIDNMWYEMRNSDDDEFYEESLEYIKNKLGVNSNIAVRYEEFRKDDPYADSHMLKEFLVDLLSDIDNY